MTKIIPARVQLAAKRGFVRTTYQAAAATLGGGITLNAVLGLVRGEIDPVVALISAAVALTSPLIAGAASYFDIASKGIPEDYQIDQV